jgi:serine/threonine-protein kinase RsbW
MADVVEFKVQARLEEIPGILDVIAATAGEVLGAAALLELQLAVDEACTNIVLHGYRGREGSIAVSCRVEDGLVVVELFDTAPPFDPTCAPPPSLDGDAASRPVGGLGIYLMRKMADTRYRREGERNILKLEKRTE